MKLTDTQKQLMVSLKVLDFGVEDVIDIFEELHSDVEALEMVLWLDPFIDQDVIPTREQVMNRAHDIAFIYKASLN